MKIKNIRVYLKDLGTNRPYTIAYKTVSEVKNVIVEVELENGIIGMGSCNPSEKVVGENVDQSFQFLAAEDFHYLIGKRIDAFEGLVKASRTNLEFRPGSHAAIDIALHDAYTRHLELSLSEYFGAHHASLPTSITIGIKSVEETLEEASEYWAMGFKYIKVKTGLSPEEDAERVLKIHEKYPDVVLRVDANQGYSPSDLNMFVKSTERLQLELIEQPFSVKNFSVHSQHLDQEVSKYLVADESLVGPREAIQLVANTPNCKIFNIKLMKSGGLSNAKEIASIAQRSGIDLMWGCNDESSISITAAMHLAFSYSHTKYIDLDGSLDLVKDVCEPGFIIKDGMMKPTGGHGLGVKILQ